VFASAGIIVINIAWTLASAKTGAVVTSQLLSSPNEIWEIAMRTGSTQATLLILGILLTTPCLILRGGQAPSELKAHSAMTKDEFEKVFKQISNWGRWGKDDQMGSVNLITPQKRVEAAALVNEGVSISMAHDELPPFEHKMLSTGSTPGAESATDLYSVQFHGYSITHMDSLCHFFWEGHMYNGYSQQEVTEKGAGKLSILNFKNGILTRGVVMDFPRLFGTPYLKSDRRIYPEDLDAWEKNTGVKIQSGDAVLVDTGRWARYAAEGEWNVSKGSAGLDATCMPWFKARNVAALGSDLAMDAMPSNIEGVSMPVHILTLVAMGAPILDNLDLEAVAKAAAARKRWTFLLTVAPLPVEGGTGSPFNPIATF